MAVASLRPLDQMTVQPDSSTSKGLRPLDRSAVARGPLTAPDTLSRTLANAGPRMDAAALDQWGDRKLPNKLVQGNHADVLIGGPTYLEALSRAIDTAKQSIVMTTNTFDDDATTTRIVDQLIAKAKAGVKVGVVLDWFGSTRKGEPKNAQRLRDGGVHVEIMDHKVFAPRVIEVNHTKVAIIDGREAFVGGQNFSGGGFGRHDLSLQVTGPVLGDIQMHFDKIWARAGNQPLDTAPAQTQPTGDLALRSLETTPKDHEFRDMVIRAIDQAKREINVEQAYMNDPEVIRHLEQAAKRGVTVRMIIPVKADDGIVDNMLRAAMPGWMKAGIEVYRYEPSMHTKALSVDGVWATVGSTNLDHRALHDNYELSLAISDPATVQKLDRDLFFTDLAQATRVTPEAAKAYVGGPKQRLVDRIKALTRHIL
jgi:cardiolipin synthase